MAGGKFVITKGPAGEFRFSLVGRKGQTVVTSETYASRASCMNGIKAVKTLAADADIEDQTKEWAAQHADMKAKAAASGATKTAAKAAKEAIAKAAPAKKTAKTDGKQAGGVARSRRPAG